MWGNMIGSAFKSGRAARAQGEELWWHRIGSASEVCEGQTEEGQWGRKMKGVAQGKGPWCARKKNSGGFQTPSGFAYWLLPGW